MAKITIYKDPTDEVIVIDGLPPGDQSAEIAALQGQLATANSKIAAGIAAVDALASKDADEDAQRVALRAALAG